MLVSFFQVIWDWITHWLIGWGGVGAVVMAILWVVWFLCPTVPILEKFLPYKTQLFYGAITATFITLWSTYIYTKGHMNGVAEITVQWDAANKRVAEEQKKRDAIIAAAAEERVRQVTVELQQQSDALQQQVDQYAKDLEVERRSKNPGNAGCVLDPDDIKRLRQFK